MPLCRMHRIKFNFFAGEMVLYGYRFDESAQGFCCIESKGASSFKLVRVGIALLDLEQHQTRIKGVAWFLSSIQVLID
jgi:hypothetical protein